MSLRVVAGSARGRKLAVPAGLATRPTSDRVRESMCNALHSLDAIDGADVLDLFAGSGALGIEALSRGAASATFVEPDRVARSVVEANLASTGLGASATVVAGDALRHLARTTARYHLVLADPPYAYADWPDLLAALAPHLHPDAVVVLESDRSVEVPPPFLVIREKRYGGTVVAFLQLLDAAPHAGDHE